MARSPDPCRQRPEANALLGRSLARRARSRCELCGAAGVALSAFEVAPFPEDPNPERAVLLCQRCFAASVGGTLDPLSWRCLESAAWSELAPLQVLAVRLARRLASERCDWAADLLGMLYLAPEIEDWLGSS